MQKTIFLTVITCVILFSILIYFLKPSENNSQISQNNIYEQTITKTVEVKKQTDTVPKDINKSAEGTNTTIQHNSFSDNQIIQALSNYIDSYENAGAATSGILAANDEKTQKYLILFTEKIANDILNNSNVSDTEKQEILWELYSKKDWQGKDNAFKAIISDALLFLDLSDVLPSIVMSYKELMNNGNRDIQEISGLIHIISNNFENNENMVNDVYLKQIHSVQSAEEIQAISEYVLTEYLNKNDQQHITNNINAIMNSVESDIHKADRLIDTLLLSAIDSPNNTQVIFNELFNPSLGTLSKKSLNKSLLFQLSEDRNFNISDIPDKHLKTIDNYINQQNVDGKEWEIVKNRIDEVLD